MQVALSAVQRRLSSINADDNESAAEIKSLTGALHQASLQYKQLLEQYRLVKSQVTSDSSTAAEYSKLQAMYKQISRDLQCSQSQLQQSQQQLQQSQEQLQQNVQETCQMHELVEKMSKAVADLHAAVDKAEAAPQARDQGAFSARHNLQAVHNAVKDKLSGRQSSNSAVEFSPDDLLLPALWKPQRERHIAPAGYR